MFLLGAGASVIGGVGALVEARPAAAQAGGATYDVRAHGAVGDGAVDDTAAIQRAVDAAQAAGGGLVLFPPGRYLVRSPGIRVTRQVHIQGVGWEPTAAPFPPGAAPNGSWLLCDDPTTSVIVLRSDPGTAAGPRGAVVRDLAVAHDQPAGADFEPAPYPAAISVGTWCTDVVLENLLLLNPTRGIEVGGPDSTVGRVTVRQIWGQPLTDGIVADGCYDVLRLEDIHFWPHWTGGARRLDVGRWQQARATGITLFRCDNPILRSIFCFGYAVGLALRQSGAGSTHKCKVSDADFDLCRTGILVSGVEGHGFDPHTLVNISIQGPDRPGKDDHGIVVDRSSSVRLALSNTAIYKFGGCGILASAERTTLLVDTIFIQDVNLLGQGAAGIRAVGGARARVGWQRDISVAHGGPEADGHVELAIGLPAAAAVLPEPPETERLDRLAPGP